MNVNIQSTYESGIEKINEFRKEVIFNAVYKHHLILFIILSLVILYMSGWSIFTENSIQIYQMSLLTDIYNYINYPITVYEFLMSGVIASVVSYGLYRLLSKRVNKIVMNIVISFFVLLFMILFECILIGPLVYALDAVELIPKLKTGFLYSFVIGCVIVVLLYHFFLNVFIYMKRFIPEIRDIHLERKFVIPENPFHILQR